MNTDVMFSSKTCEWETPIEFFKKYDAKYHFTLDVCATKENAKCEKFFTRDDDALTREWNGVCWMNPPYGREIGKWVKKAFETALRGDSRLLAPCANRHRMVARLLYEG